MAPTSFRGDGGQGLLERGDLRAAAVQLSLQMVHVGRQPCYVALCTHRQQNNEFTVYIVRTAFTMGLIGGSRAVALGSQ